MNNFVTYRESIIIFDSSGSAVVIKDTNSMVLDLPVTDSYLPCIFYNKTTTNSENSLSFLNPSSKSKLAKRCTIELKLRLKVMKGISFSKRFYVNRFRFYKKHILNMFKSFNLFISLFSYSFEINFLYIKSYGFEFRYLEIVCNYSGGNFRIVYSSLVMCFRFLFLEVNVLSQSSIFPNPEVERSFNTVEEFDNFTHSNNLSFTNLSSSIERVSDVEGDLVLRSLYGGELTNLEYRSESFFREGVKFQINKFYHSKGVVDKFSFKPIFNESLLYSCYSVSSYYNSVPYRDVLSFSTGGRMSKSCKTFKNYKK